MRGSMKDGGGGCEEDSLFLSLRYNLIRDICAQAGSFSMEET